MKYEIRAIKNDEIPLLKDFLYEAIFQRDENNLLPREVVYQPELWVYVEDFGKKPDDLCLVAVCGGKVCGAVWTRIIDGFGHLDADTPEFAVSLYKEYRGMGMGTALMKAMLALLREKGCKQTSLSVQKDNYAVKMYESVGFKIIRELEEEYLMLCRL